MEKLNMMGTKEKYKEIINQKINETLTNITNIEQDWEIIKKCIIDGAEENIGIENQKSKKRDLRFKQVDKN